MTDLASKPLPNQLLLPFPEEDEEPGDWRTATTKDTKVNDDRCNHRMPGVPAHTKE